MIVALPVASVNDNTANGGLFEANLVAQMPFSSAKNDTKTTTPYSIFFL